MRRKRFRECETSILKDDLCDTCIYSYPKILMFQNSTNSPSPISKTNLRSPASQLSNLHIRALFALLGQHQEVKAEELQSSALPLGHVTKMLQIQNT